jgi:hypothetical protein
VSEQTCQHAFGKSTEASWRWCRLCGLPEAVTLLAAAEAEAARWKANDAASTQAIADTTVAWNTALAELSRAKGEIDAAHVVLTAAGVACHPALADRISSYIGETETKLEEQDDTIKAMSERTERHCTMLVSRDDIIQRLNSDLRAAEARATTAEQVIKLAHVVLNHRGAIADDSLVHRVTTLVARLEDKLAAAEQREAEKDKALREIVEKAYHVTDGGTIYSIATAALASPSTPGAPRRYYRETGPDGRPTGGGCWLP